MMFRFFLIALLSVVCYASYEDSRCKCVCVDHSVPKNSSEASLEPKRTVYVKSIPSDKCTCPLMLEDKSDLCPYCDCKYQVVVVIIIVIICTLSLYLAFMLILNPFLASRGLRSANMPAPATSFSPSKSVRTFRGHVAQREHDFKNFAGPADGVDNATGSSQIINGPSSSSATTAVNRAREQQSRWNGRVKEQRDRVFNERTLLN